ncbi:uncharacterized protein BcabD6B2_02010 [Babesia caballi]|uniref:Uncharacterized protein n=1 Tax=Babesia caballi TaxID=5871 RepID=A0AAV4LLD8_BABCB|nr:hypothetical protein, conserved [Babesia caballi]
MKVVSRGEPVSNAEALMCVRRRLEEHRKQYDNARPDATRDVDMAEAGCLNGSDAQATGSEEGHSPLPTEVAEWHRRIKKLLEFSLDAPRASESEVNRIRFLETLERYLVSIA